MTEITLKKLATDIQISLDRLIQQFCDMGIKKSAEDSVTPQEKQVLLTHLNLDDSYPNKLTLQRKIRSTLNIFCVNGKSKSVQIEVRKKRVFFKKNQEVEEDLFLERKEPCSMIEQTNKCEKKIIKNDIELKTKRSSIEEIIVKNDTTKKNNFNNQKSDVIIKNKKEKKTYFENNNTELKHEKTIKLKYEKEKKHRKFKENSRHLKEVRFITNKNNYDDSVKYNNSDFIEDLNDYYLNAFQHMHRNDIHQNNNNDHEIKKNCGRNKKFTRLKKIDRHLESKIDREELRDSYNKGDRRKNPILQQSFQKPIKTFSREVIIGETITVSELANKMAIKSSQVIKMIIKLGAMATINQVIDQETAQLVAEEMGHKVILRRENELEETIMNDRDVNEKAEPRAPVVTIMGHVDHGKTSLLDYIRSTKMASKEAGGITQHIGAYHVETEKGMITFLDTPGHAAFTSMRARGTKITDIVVLVIAADDGVMPQTIEAIQHAKAASVPIIVAVNKIDKLESDPDRVKNDLTKYGILPEEWGGDCQFVYVSAKKGTGIDELLNTILLQAEIMELKAIRKGMATGSVIESFLDKGRGPVATVLVKEGTLKKGDIVLCGFEYGRIRAMRDELGKEIIKAGPSIPVEILGLSGVPLAGQEMTVVRDEKKAREVALYRQGKFREVKLANQKQSKLEDMFFNMNENNTREINIILKADVQGSVEAIFNSLIKLSTDKVKVNIISSGVGGITETDASLAAACKAILIGFNVRAEASARRIIDVQNLNLRYYSIIYNLIDEIKAAIDGVISPKLKQKIIGLAEVRNIFKSPKFGAIAGCMVTEGIVKRHNPIHILRDNVVVYEGELESLRRFKDDLNEVRNGMECGIGIKNYNDVRTGDIIEVLEIIEI